MDYESLLETRQAFGSPAGKHWSAKYIVPLIPKHKIYVEPFVGGGAIFWKKDKAISETEVINDLDSEIAFAYKFMRDCTDSDIAELKKKYWIGNKNHFEKLKNSEEPKNPLEKFYNYIYLKMHSFGYGKNSLSPSKAGQKIAMVNFLEEFRNRLKNVKIYNKDYEQILKEFDSPDTCFYLDPPYEGTATELLKAKIMDFDKMLKQFKNLKGNVLFSYNKKVPGFIWDKKIRTHIALTHNSDNINKHKRTEYLMANFTPSKQSLKESYEAIQKELYPKFNPLQEFKKENYNPAEVTDEQLRDDWRLILAKYSTMKDGGKTEFKNIPEVVSYAHMILAEILNRDFERMESADKNTNERSLVMDFHPEDYEENSLELLHKLFTEFVTKRFIVNPATEIKGDFPDNIEELITDKRYSLYKFNILSDGNKLYGWIRFFLPTESVPSDNKYHYQVRDYIPFENPIPEKVDDKENRFYFKEPIKEFFELEKYDPVIIAKISNEDLIKLFNELRQDWIQRGRNAGDESVINANLLLRNELLKRGIPLPKQDELDILSVNLTENNTSDLVLKNTKELPEFVWIPNFISVTGSSIYAKDRNPNDLDIVVRAKDIDPGLWLKLQRVYEKLYQKNLHLVPAPYGPNWKHCPQYDLVLRPVKNPQLVDVNEPEFESKLYEQRAGTPEIKAQAEESLKEDKLKPFRFYHAIKPMQSVFEKERQTFDNFANERFFKDDTFPVFISKKYDGARHLFTKVKDKVLIMSEDGTDNTDRFPGIVKAIQTEIKYKNAMGEIEIEAWEGNKHLPREYTAGYLNLKAEPDDSKFIGNIIFLLYADGKDLHNLTEEERFNFLNDCGVKYSTIGVPDVKKHKLNLAPQHKVSNLKQIQEISPIIINAPGSEGLIARMHDMIYYLDSNPKGKMIKFHKSSILNGIVIEAIETKTAGVFNYVYAISPGKVAIEKELIRKLDGKDYIEVGKTFSTAEKLKAGDKIQIEFETLNFVYDEGKESWTISAWAPRFIKEMKDEQIDNVEQVISRAKKDNVLSRKTILENGSVLYESVIFDDMQESEIEAVLSLLNIKTHLEELS